MRGRTGPLLRQRRPTAEGKTGGSAFNPTSFYSYHLDPAADVPSLPRTYAGPQASIGL
ncbi:hypothetical protein [Nonomuraea bangladeshensis]|uniref:hypothetical protein n=1 Tax=Nonomuraea bangladeshensis TaxID=404385 RepID=UPI0031CE1EDC